MSERWFSDEELAELSRPTMDKAIEAIEAGDLERAKALCEEMKHEWRFLHDLMVHGVAALLTFIQQRLGEDAVREAQDVDEGFWKRAVEKIDATDRRAIVYALAATWRAHSGSGTGPAPGAFTISEDDEKVTFAMNPCGSGQRLWRTGAYRGEGAYGLTREPHDWSYGRKDFPIYCTHCTFMNESLPLRWIGRPLYPSHPPGDYDHDPCVWHWYKDPDAIPAEYYERYGAAKPS
jgi:hypothetical protein